MKKQQKKNLLIVGGIALVLIVAGALYMAQGSLFSGYLQGGPKIAKFDGGLNTNMLADYSSQNDRLVEAYMNPNDYMSFYFNMTGKDIPAKAYFYINNHQINTETSIYLSNIATYRPNGVDQQFVYYKLPDGTAQIRYYAKTGYLLNKVLSMSPYGPLTMSDTTGQTKLKLCNEDESFCNESTQNDNSTGYHSTYKYQLM